MRTQYPGFNRHSRPQGFVVWALVLLLWGVSGALVSPAVAQGGTNVGTGARGAPFDAWALGLLSTKTVPDGQPLPQASVEYALSGTTRRISGIVLRDSRTATPAPADLQVELLSPPQGVRLVPTGNGWDLVLTPQATQPGARLTVRIAARSAARGHQVLLHGRVDVLARREARMLVPAAGGRFQLADRVIEFDAVPAARGSSIRDVTVHYGQLPGSSAMISRVLPSGLRDAAAGSAAAVGTYRIVPSEQTRAAAAQPEAASLVEELNTTTPYSFVPSLLRHVWADYRGPYISLGERRLPVADVDSVDSESGQLTSLVSTGWPETQWATVTPVLFVHGYASHLFYGPPHFSGGRGYWGNLPNLVRQYTGNAARRFAPFEYRWNTDVQFRVQGAELAAAINTIYSQTGRKVIIVAHSFGGLLVRTVLQNLAGAEGGLARNRVESVMTLGTPHSGIADSATTLHGVALPIGQQPALLNPFPVCAQVSCYVAGEAVEELDSSLSRLGLTAEPGVDVATLFSTAAQLPSVRLAQGVGVDQDDFQGEFNYIYSRGDGLITIEGQRLFPNEVAGAFRGWSTVAGSPVIVKEVVLGHFDGPYFIRPGEWVDTSRWVPTDRWASEGYFHGELNGWKALEPFAGREAQVPATATSGCNKTATCQHASWRLLLELLGGGRLNDTGQRTCVNPISGNMPLSCVGTGQDGESGRDVYANASFDGRAGFSFVKISGDGEDLPANASSWDCVRDTITGLVWENKTDDGGLRDKDKTYTNLGNSQADDASGFASAVNSVGLCGYRDWRLPDRFELQGLVDYGVLYPGPVIETSWFPHTVGAGYWTSTRYLGYRLSAVGIDFGYGYVYDNDRTFYRAIRLVRKDR